MKNNISSIIWGLVLIAIGVILGGNALGWFDINLFFDGWWTLFIIVPCTIGLLTNHDYASDIIGIIVGVVLLLACQNVISFELIWKLFLPIIIILFGLIMIFRNVFAFKFNQQIAELNKKINKDDNMVAIFSGQKINLAGETFKGKNISAVFGGLDLDLSEAKIKEDVVINASAIFGGINIKVPDNVIIKTKSNSIFGGITNKKTTASDKGHIIYINGMSLFGGIEIK